MSCLPGTANCTDCVIGEYQVRIQPFLISATLQWLNYSMAQSSGGQIVCLVCPPGHYCPQPNTHTATPCPAGQYMEDSGRTACLACGDGTASAAGSTSCSPCANSACNLTVGGVCGQVPLSPRCCLLMLSCSSPQPSCCLLMLSCSSPLARAAAKLQLPFSQRCS